MIPTNRPRLYRGCTPVVDSWFDVGLDGSLTPALVDAIAEAKGVTAGEIPPLYRAVDLDALSRLFEHPAEAGRRDSLFEFVVDDLIVFVRGDGRIRVCDTTRPTGPEPVFATSLR